MVMQRLQVSLLFCVRKHKRGLTHQTSHHPATAFTLLSLLLAVYLCAPFVQATERQAKKIVNVELVPNWDFTPLLLEARFFSPPPYGPHAPPPKVASPCHLMNTKCSEFVASEGNELFWQFLENVLNRTGDQASERDQYEAALAAGREVLSSMQQSLMNYTLQLRYHSAKVEMHRQFSRQARDVFYRSRQCPDQAWVHIGNHIMCSPDLLSQFLNGSPSK